jgi:hypothetical protein
MRGVARPPRGSANPLDRRADRGDPHRRGLRRAEVAVHGLQQPAVQAEGCGLERLNYGLASEGKTRWCAGCGGAEGAVLLRRQQMCEGCGRKRPHYWRRRRQTCSSATFPVLTARSRAVLCQGVPPSRGPRGQRAAPHSARFPPRSQQPHPTSPHSRECPPRSQFLFRIPNSSRGNKNLLLCREPLLGQKLEPQCRGAWARVTIAQRRHLALQTGWGHH